MKIIVPILILFTFLSCKKETPKTPSTPIAQRIEEKKPVSSPPITSDKKAAEPTPDYLTYAFRSKPISLNLTNLVETPKGYSRVEVAKYSYAEWLRFLPVKPKDQPVKLFNGELKSNQNVHFAVLDIDVEQRDLQQCADAVMRLKAEYHFGLSDFSTIHFNFTSGDKVAFTDWSKGRKPQVSGNSVRFSEPGNTVDHSYKNFRKYMTMIFNYAGTASLSKELKSIPVEQMQIGDVFIQGGFPGHAVIVIDMAENSQNEKLFLLAQSYMPAQDIHILKNYSNNDLSPWYSLNFENELNTPEWTFYKNNLKRFND